MCLPGISLYAQMFSFLLLIILDITDCVKRTDTAILLVRCVSLEWVVFWNKNHSKYALLPHKQITLMITEKEVNIGKRSDVQAAGLDAV